MKVDLNDVLFEQIVTPYGFDSKVSYGAKVSPVDIISEFRPDLMLLEGYDDCIVGVVERVGSMMAVCYNTALILKKLEKDMTRDEAIEYFDYNILDAYMGDHTPCFIEIL